MPRCSSPPNWKHACASLLPPGPRTYTTLSAKEVVVRFRGLACLRWHESGVCFGVRDLKTKWDPGKAKKSEQLFRELEMYRHPLASETRHPLFRTQAQRWLESLVRQDVTRADSTFDPHFAYAQVLASTAGEHGILDVLSVTRAGRLAILELKTVEHPVFLLQGAKYWLRISRHLEREDSPRYGYFSGGRCSPLRRSSILSRRHSAFILPPRFSCVI